MRAHGAARDSDWLRGRISRARHRIPKWALISAAAISRCLSPHGGNAARTTIGHRIESAKSWPALLSRSCRAHRQWAPHRDYSRVTTLDSTKLTEICLALRLPSLPIPSVTWKSYARSSASSRYGRGHQYRARVRVSTSPVDKSQDRSKERRSRALNLPARLRRPLELPLAGETRALGQSLPAKTHARTRECLARGRTFLRRYGFAGCARRCAHARARSACCPFGLGDRGHLPASPRDPAGSRRVAGPFESAPAPPAPGPARCIALHRAAVHAVLVWARGHRSQTHRGGSQRRESPRRSPLASPKRRGRLRRSDYPCLRTEGESDQDRGSSIAYRDIDSRGSPPPRGGTPILSTAVLRPRRFSGWVEDLGWKVHAEKTIGIDEERRRGGEEEEEREREGARRARGTTEILIFPRRRIARGTLSRS